MNGTPKTRYSLIGKLRDSQDAAAWREFTNIYQPLVFRICLSKGLQHADATDVTQEVLAKVAEAIEGFDASRQQATFRGWLYAVTRNLVVDFFREQRRHAPAGGEGATLAESDSGPEASAAFELEHRRQVFLEASAIVQEQVQAKTWRAFWLTEVEKKPVDAVADELGMQPGAIYMARSRVFSRLKAAVDQQLDGIHEVTE